LPNVKKEDFEKSHYFAREKVKSFKKKEFFPKIHTKKG